MKSYYQGNVDYFCAVYAIINAIRVAAGKYHYFSFKEGCRFYQYLIRFLYDRERFLEVLYGGTSHELMNDLLLAAKVYLKENYKLDLFYKRPFKFREISLKQAMNILGKFLKQKHRSCIIRFHNDEVGDHWSVLRSRSFGKLLMCDSYFCSHISIKHSTFSPYKKDGLTHIAKEGLIFVKVVPCKLEK